MNAKLLSAAGGLLLLAATILPSALGHDERPALAIPYGGDPDGVSGRYVGAAGPALAIEADNQSHPAYDVLATGGMLCDFEVFVDDATYPGNSGNEPLVDGAFGGTSPNGEFWDDGGNGGACHWISYQTEGFNTPGCQGGQTARASNGATDVFIGAACDWKTDDGNSGSSSGTTLLLCLINGALAFNPLEPPVPTGAVDQAQVFVGCAEAYVECLLDSCVGPPEPYCGADGTSDAIDYGYGSGNLNPATFPVATGIGIPPWTGPCSPGDEVASIFVFDTVATNGGSLVDPDGAGLLDPVYVPGSVTVHPALTGELWTDL